MRITEKTIKWREFCEDVIIRASPVMSTLCNSIFRLEPYKNCMFQCRYCYARAPTEKDVIVVRKNYPSLFKRLVSILRRTLNGMLPAFRLSTLSDPFQPIEKKYKLSLEILKIAKKYEVPIILNTKGTLLVDEPWISLINELNKRGLIIVQITIVLLDDDEARIIEPLAPPPSERLSVAKALAEKGIPVIFRFQPLVPYVNTSVKYVEKFANIAKRIGIKQVISEFLRYRYDHEILPFTEILRLRGEKPNKLLDSNIWEDIPETIQKRAKVDIRRAIFKEIHDILRTHNINFSTCREGFFRYHTADSCCGVHYLSKVLWRKTIYELKSQQTSIKENIVLFDNSFLASFKIRRIREKLKEHFAMLSKVINNTQLLRQICPDCDLFL
ncbi:MAG: radical SAM protein [Candidatus Odinarchaeota archaeon]|nr:radical SAM protein [Candidatus Odinarchaeota archaeon]